MILSCQNVKKSFGTVEVLKDITFHIEKGEKVALTGINGCGKSTLIRMIAGEGEPDSGSITLQRGLQIGYLKQSQDTDRAVGIYEELCSARQEVFDLEERLRDLEKNMKQAKGDVLSSMMETYTNVMHRFEQLNGYAARSEIQGVFKGLGFSENDQSRLLSTLSGGQKTRVALGKILLQSCDLLLLDEPTNHLDMDSISWLEGFLNTYQGAVLLVSHDRYFLDHVVTRVVEIENGNALSFSGNYTTYSQKKAEVRRAQYRAYLKQQDEIRHQQEVIARFRQFNREKSVKQAESREKALASMERIEQPKELHADMKLTLAPRIESGKDVLRITDLSKSFGEMTLFQKQNIELFRGERLAVIGSNGTGKTTLLKIISGILEPDEGSIEYGAKLHIGYFDQEHRQLNMDKTIFEEISDAYPSLTNTEIRNVLAAFLFTGDDVFQPLSTLSGGEQGRVALAKLMLSEANLLILDEPTNHLDVVSKEILEDALNQYTGTVLYVSHDRYFINRTATRILELVNGTFVNYIGNFDYYIEKRQELTQIYAPASDEADSHGRPEETSSKLSWREQKEAQARERKRERLLKETEEKITKTEEELSELDRILSLPETGTDLELCQKLTLEQAQLAEALEMLYAEWEKLAE